jgi:hypothetical protein
MLITGSRRPPSHILTPCERARPFCCALDQQTHCFLNHRDKPIFDAGIDFD